MYHFWDMSWYINTIYNTVLNKLLRIHGIKPYIYTLYSRKKGEENKKPSMYLTPF